MPFFEISKHKAFAAEWDELIAKDNVFSLLNAKQTCPQLLKYVRVLDCSTATTQSREILEAIREDLETNDDFYLIRDSLDMSDIEHQISRGEAIEVLVYLLPYLSCLTSLKVLLTNETSELLAANLVERQLRLKHVTFSGLGQYPSVPPI